ncbi:MAG: hypothetical protein J0I31_13695 [Rhizobiales bacterium]|nr:hypothetical protein [Hyphomicrobiales bacterium]
MQSIILGVLALGAGYVLGRCRTREDLIASLIIVALVGALVLMGTR